MNPLDRANCSFLQCAAGVLLQSLREMEEELTVATLTLAARDRATLNDYVHAVASLTPRAMRLLGDFKMTTGEVLGRLPAECKVSIEKMP